MHLPKKFPICTPEEVRRMEHEIALAQLRLARNAITASWRLLLRFSRSRLRRHAPRPERRGYGAAAWLAATGPVSFDSRLRS